jgi:hypothetical protein
LCGDDPDSYTSGNIATGGASHARQVEVDETDKKRYRDFPGWGLGLEAKSLTLVKKKNLIVEKPNDGHRLDKSGERPRKVKDKQNT